MLRAENRKIYLALVFVFISISIGAFLLGHKTFAETEVVDVVTVTVPASCNLTTTVDGGNTYTLNMTPRQYKNDIGPSTFSVFCNNNEGFSIYAIGFSNNEYGNTKMITNDPDLFINTGTNTSGSPSSWAMKLSAVTASGDNAYTPSIVSPYNNFAVVPSSYTKVATVTSVTTGNAEASVQATYAVYVAGDQIAGTYTGKVKYTVVHPATNVPNEPKDCAANTICYWPNVGNTVDDTMGDQGITASDTSATLWASNFKRAKYGFVGWSDKFDWELNANDASGNGTGSNAGYHIYGPNATITFTAGQYSNTNGGLSLYAVWAPSTGTLQGYTCPDNTAMPIGKVTALTDLRDNDTYAIAKLADGKCWMIENLRLDYDANFDELLSQGFGKSTTYGNFIGLAEPETTNVFSYYTTANSVYYSGIQSGTAKIDVGTTSNPDFRMPRYRNDNTNTDSVINANVNTNNMTGTSQNIYSYGNYYTWSAALANTIYYSANATDADGKTSETVNTSLCPAGWKLPRGGDKSSEATNDFWALIVTGINSGTNPANYDGSDRPYYTGKSEEENAAKAVRAYPNNFLYSGIVDTGLVKDRGSKGYYWSSTVFNNNPTFSYLLLLSYYSTSNPVYPGTMYDYKYYGRSIRCIADS